VEVTTYRRAASGLVVGLLALTACAGDPARSSSSDRRTATEVATSASTPPAPPTSVASPSSGGTSTAAVPSASAEPIPPVTDTLFPPRADGLPVVVESGPRDSRRIALTFDADMTPHMLRRLETGETASYYNAHLISELRRLHVPATLFLTGLWMQRYPEVTRELAADPLFELGTHTWEHRAFTADCYGLSQVPALEMPDEVIRAQRLLEELAGNRATKLFRFPGGCFDEAALRATAPSGVTVIQFDVAGGDGFQSEAGPIIRTVVDGVRSGSIVVLHMNGGNTSPRTAEAVGPIVEQLRAKGYTLSTVSGLFAP
jgi:peptidoglycan-N-acetylglucosamine deacetylase